MTDLLRKLGNDASNCWSTSRGVARHNADGSYTLLYKTQNANQAQCVLWRWAAEIRRYAPNPRRVG